MTEGMGEKKKGKVIHVLQRHLSNLPGWCGWRDGWREAGGEALED